MAEAVVDLLEVVDVGQQQREALTARERVRQGLVEGAPVGQARQRVDARHVVLVALGGDQAALEELDRGQDADVGDRVAERAPDHQVVVVGGGDQRRGVRADLERRQRPGVAAREEIGHVEHRQHQHGRHVGVRPAGQPERGDHERLQRGDGHRVAADRDAMPGDQPA